MTLLRCTIHNVTFGAEPMELHLIECPACMRQKIQQLSERVTTISSHRDALLRAIEIKQTVELQNSNPVAP